VSFQRAADQSVKSYLPRAGGNARALENFFEANSLPARVAHRAIAHLTAGHPRLKETAAVARTLVSPPPLLPERNIDFKSAIESTEPRIDFAFNFQTKRVGVHFERRAILRDGNAQEGVVRRDPLSLKTSNGVSSCGGRVVMRMTGRFCGYLTSGRSPFSNGNVTVGSASTCQACPPSQRPSPAKTGRPYESSAIRQRLIRVTGFRHRLKILKDYEKRTPISGFPSTTL
jgi:hypothetical protein